MSNQANHEMRKMLRDKIGHHIAGRGGMIDISEIYPSQVLDFHAPLGISPSIPLGNMSICLLEDGNYLMSVRQFNYILLPVSAKLRFFHNFMSDRNNHFIIVDREFRFVKKVPCDRADILPKLEDMRLTRFGDIIQVSGTDISLGGGKHKMACFDFHLAEDGLHMMKSYTFPLLKEKNYVPIEDGHGIFISDMLSQSIKITTTSDIHVKTEQKCQGLIPYRGSSQLLRYRDGYVALVHNRKAHVFKNAFAFFDKALITCRISDEFTAFCVNSPVNFTCGMVIDGDTAILPVCVHDRETHLFRLPLQDFSVTARWRS